MRMKHKGLTCRLDQSTETAVKCNPLLIMSKVSSKNTFNSKRNVRRCVVDQRQKTRLSFRCWYSVLTQSENRKIL